jgi:TRAP-type mannitol/chloroaromatic compound transport system substrate-binding protein
VPFGFTAQQNQAWKLHGNGRKLLDELFAKYNFTPAARSTPAPRWAAGTARR